MAPARKGWGSLARKGAAAMRSDGPGRRSSREEERQERPRDAAEEYVVERIDEKPTSNTSKRKSESDGGWRIPPDALKEIEERAAPRRVERLTKALKDAARAYAAERFGDVRKALRPLLAEVPDAPAVQELHGMLLYRTGKWAAAYKELEASHAATNLYDLVPAMMDCKRAQKRYDEVENLWEDLRQASPAAEVMAEGRIVMAETLAVQGRIEDGLRLLEKLPRPKRQPQLHHLRTWYVAADLYERAGNVAKARLLFDKVARTDPELADVLDRLEMLD